MCTAAAVWAQGLYFGRTLDNACSYGEEVVVTPRRKALAFRRMGVLERHHAMIGMAHVADGFPLYYDGVNEKGLAMAGLNFVGNACYRENMAGKDNVAQFEFLPWVLGQCATVAEARDLLARVNVTGEDFSTELPAAQLHWMLADREEAIVVESVRDGLRVYDNPVGVLTNNPPFDEQLFQLNNYLHLSAHMPENRFSDKLDLRPYSYGMGALGLPGDLSSQSRFVRAAFVKLNAEMPDTQSAQISQFFHILGTVEQVRGCSRMEEGASEITLYISCCQADKGIYYYTTYGNRQITAVDMHGCSLEGRELKRFSLVQGEQIHWQRE